MKWEKDRHVATRFFKRSELNQIIKSKKVIKLNLFTEIFLQLLKGYFSLLMKQITGKAQNITVWQDDLRIK